MENPGNRQQLSESSTAQFAQSSGLHIIYYGKVTGAVGVSGLTEDEDIALAQVGVAVLTS